MTEQGLKELRTVRPADVPEEYADLVACLGMEGFLRLSQLCGGETLYIPKRESLLRAARDREIRARFDGGNHRGLARQFRLSERQVRKILAKRDGRASPA